MSLQQFEITPEQLQGVGVIGLADVPGLSAREMQEKLEQTAREVIVPRFNAALAETDDALRRRPTAQSVEESIRTRMEAIGAGDMAKAVYDPAGLARDVFAAGSAARPGMVQLCDSAEGKKTAAQGVAATPAAVAAAAAKLETKLAALTQTAEQQTVKTAALESRFGGIARIETVNELPPYPLPDVLYLVKE